ncbi:Exoribonuclease II protein [Dioscorea alata]|uniref:Exoribonuclease II protein n=1 Tax=Dioscorea alata TaxID=55571 RepID=A0ACB7W8B5_DIOAL|nr:Exoribonuclease II protein [Dioscorea alata]
MAEPVVAANGLVERLTTAASEEMEKDRRKKRRNNRRPKHCPSPYPGAACSSMDGVCGPAPEWVENGSVGGLNVYPVKGFNSLPVMHINSNSGIIRPPPAFPPPEVMKISRSCPLPAPSPHTKSLPKKMENKNYFSPYWSHDAVEDAIKKGQAFKATFRVNAHNRLEAYCTIEGLPIDVLINGAAAQNRAIEGDVVALMLDPVASWTRLKGSNLSGNYNSSYDSNKFSESKELVVHKFAIKENSNADYDFITSSNGTSPLDRGCNCHGDNNINLAVHCGPGAGVGHYDQRCNGHNTSSLDGAERSPAFQQDEAVRALERICAMAYSNPSKRPTGKIIGIIKKSARRRAIIGFLGAKQWLCKEVAHEMQIHGQCSDNHRSSVEFMELFPNDFKFPKMVVKVSSLPNFIVERLNKGDATVGKELVAAQIDEWSEGSLSPQAQVLRILGDGGEVESQIAAIFFENSIHPATFSSELLDCIPVDPWSVPSKELHIRKDLRNICTFTIDPSSAVDLDDALSVEVVSNGIYRVGVHIADVAYLVTPGTALDAEAQLRSTSVYILQHKSPMLPSKLSDACSLNPGVDRLALSITWDIDHSGEIIDRWIGRSVIQSCCKLSYEFVQDIIDGSLDVDKLDMTERSIPKLHGGLEWKDVVKSLRDLHEISTKLREIRFKDGALSLENAKLAFLFDEFGNPCGSYFNERKDSNSLVEEFMLLANISVAEVISRAFPDCALLRRHPEPNSRKLKDFEAFCNKHGFELETSSSRLLHLSLLKMKEKLKDDPVLFEILINYASKPMQPAMYFCTGDSKGLEYDWAHYALSLPFYTHFTSPLRRYPDVIVQRTLCAALEAEESYLKERRILVDSNEKSGLSYGCFTCLYFNKDAAESIEGQEVLKTAALKFKVPGTEVLGEIATYCNERKFASKRAEEASEKLCFWALLKKKEFVVSEARVLGLGPRFMSVYIPKFGMERRIYYDDVEGLSVEWLETTCTLVLDLPKINPLLRKDSPGKLRSPMDVAMLIDPSQVFLPEDDNVNQEGQNGVSSLHPGSQDKDRIEPSFFPLTLQHLSSLPVALHAVGGNDGPVDIGVRLYMCSYFGES